MLRGSSQYTFRNHLTAMHREAVIRDQNIVKSQFFHLGFREAFSLLPSCLCGFILSNTMELGGFRKDTYPKFDIPFSVFPAVQYFAIFICGAVYYKLFLILVFLKGIFYRCFPLCTTFSIEFLVLSEQLYWQYPLLYSNMSEPMCLQYRPKAPSNIKTCNLIRKLL